MTDCCRVFEQQEGGEASAQVEPAGEHTRHVEAEPLRRSDEEEGRAHGTQDAVRQNAQAG